METIKQKRITDTEVIGIILVKEWFKNSSFFSIYKDYFVVGKWFEYLGGMKNEGMQTIAMCKDIEDAELVYHRNSEI